jgi:hypothetical protein
LKEEIRKKSFKQKEFFNFLFNQAKARKAYDMLQEIKSAVDALDDLLFGINGLAYNKEDFSKFFCPQAVAIEK